jgi:predicted RNase H-like HicB family nuclease
MKYAIIFEKGDCVFGAYVPELPGCVSVGETRDEVLHLIREAIQFHLEGLRENGESIPEALSSAEYIEVIAA